LRYDEIWISESQERMVLAVPRGNLEALRRICDEERVEMAELGVFGVEGESGPELVLRYEGEEVGRMGMGFLHEGLPRGVREAEWRKAQRHEGTKAQREGGEEGKQEAGSGKPERAPDVDVKATLLDLLAHPNIASKRWIVRQYDHEVQGGTVLKPLVGPGGIGPGDAAVIQPVPGSKKGLAIACGLAIPVGDPARPPHGGDPYLMALAAVDECVRNLVCVGANPDRIAILDNFCWASCAKPENLGALVRAAEGCYDAAKAYRTPFISGKDSLNNQFRTESGQVIEIPPTLLITGVGIVEDVGKCVTMDLKDGESIWMIGPPNTDHANARRGEILRHGPSVARAVHEMVREGIVVAAHDCSEGGVLVAASETVLASSGRFGMMVLAEPRGGTGQEPVRGVFDSAYLFGGSPCRILVQLRGEKFIKEELRAMSAICERYGLGLWYVGTPRPEHAGVTIQTVPPSSRGEVHRVVVDRADLARAFLGSLDW
jgi:phosphoribosylformylglycinamidine synthase